jgi:uncharacterized cupredoxin-like copper-binding protein
MRSEKQKEKLMKYRMAFGVFLIMILAIVAACGSSTAPSGTQTGQAPTGSSPTGQASPTGTQSVYVNLFDNRIESSLTRYVPGTSYHFVVTNKGNTAYTFAMMSQDGERDMEHMSLEERHHTALFMYDSIAPGETKAFDYTFGSSMMQQHLEFACYQDGQSQPGMRLPFTMEPHY